MQDERRQARRLKLGSPAKIFPEGGAAIEAECIELGVGGMTLRAAYVPGESEVFKVEVQSPPGALSRPPLIANVAVRRCHMVTNGIYEIGVSVVEILE